MSSTKFLSTVVLAMAIAFSACKKEAVTGPQGEQGPAGTNGKDGNANVVSGTVSVTSASWTYDAPSFSYFVNIPSQSITQSVLNTGAVLVYVKVSDNPVVWTQLPITLYLDPTYSSTLEVDTSLNLIQIIWTDSDLTQPNRPPALTFKIVVISSTGTLLSSNVNWSDYLQVKESFNLKD
jgi:hypothetical protein